MDHVEALKRQAAERYLLGELSVRENEEFEEHYFDCQECARDVETGALFVDNATAIFREEPRASPVPAPEETKPRRRILDLFTDLWRSPLAAAPAFATVALAALCGFQGLVLIPGLRHSVAELSSPHAVDEFAVFEMTRGEPGVIPVRSGAVTVNLRIDPTWGGGFPEYRLELWDSAGKRRAAWDASAPESGRPMLIGLSPRSLGPGRYTIKIAGLRADGSVQPELAAYAFTLEFSKG
jgi:hypothetical protein